MENIRRIYLNNKMRRMTVRNQNWIAVVVGATGSGKTYGALETSDDMMGRKLDPYTHIVFSIEEFMTNLNANKFKKGQIVVFEEAGVNISSKNWQSKANKNINFVLQTCRHRNFGIVFTLPMFAFLDSSTRALIHTAFVTDEIDYMRGLAYLRVFDIKVDALRGTDPYMIYPKFRINHEVITMKRIACKMPRQELVDVYEERKQQFTNKLNKDIEMQLKAESRQTEEKNKDILPCPVCLGRSWREKNKSGTWRCRKCGNEVGVNPYTLDNGKGITTTDQK